jgi:hypothetical protein
VNSISILNSLNKNNPNNPLINADVKNGKIYWGSW